MTRSDAVYVRKSTSPQEEQSQIDALEDYLKRQSITVPKEFWFTDTGSRHRPKDRPDFQRMLKLVEEKKIRRVFVWKQDRIVSGAKLWGRTTYCFEETGTQLIDILTGKDLAADDIATDITTVVHATGAKEEQRKISQNTLRAKVSLAKKGMPISKISPYGYDKKYLDPSGKHLWTVHVLTAAQTKGGTRYLAIMPDGNRYEMDEPYRKGKGGWIVYVPTEVAPERIKVVQFAFETFATESMTVAKLAVRMNQLGFTIYGRPWRKMTLEGLLRNPAYIGTVRLNNVSRGEFTVYDGTQLVAAKNADRKLVRNPSERQIITPDQHEPLIKRETWDRVQEKLSSRQSGPTPPKRDDLWLRGLLVCGGCERPMHTWCQGKTTKGYICGSYYRYQQTHSPQDDTGCGRNWVSHEDAEKLISARLGEALELPSSPDAAESFNRLFVGITGVRLELQTALAIAVNTYLGELVKVFDSAEGDDTEVAQLLQRAGRVRRQIEDAELAAEIDRHGDGLFSPQQARDLFVYFETTKLKLARKKIAALEEEYKHWVLVKAKPETDRERETARARCRELEQQLDEWESRSTPIDVRVGQLRAHFADQRRQLKEAHAALVGGSNLRRAEVVRGMFSRIVFHFRREKREKYSRTVWLADKTEFEINPMDGSCPRSSHRFHGRAPTGRPRLRGSRRRTRWS